MGTFSDDSRFADLISALALIAADEEQQRSALPELSAIGAEILRGDAAVELIDETLVREGVLPPEVGALIERIDALFDELLLRERELSSATLLEAHEWRRMRVLAREALEMLGMGRSGDARGPAHDGDQLSALDQT